MIRYPFVSENKRRRKSSPQSSRQGKGHLLSIGSWISLSASRPMQSWSTFHEWAIAPIRKGGTVIVLDGSWETSFRPIEPVPS